MPHNQKKTYDETGFFYFDKEAYRHIYYAPHCLKRLPLYRQNDPDYRKLPVIYTFSKRQDVKNNPFYKVEVPELWVSCVYTEIFDYTAGVLRDIPVKAVKMGGKSKPITALHATFKVRNTAVVKKLIFIQGGSSKVNKNSTEITQVLSKKSELKTFLTGMDRYLQTNHKTLTKTQDKIAASCGYAQGKMLYTRIMVSFLNTNSPGYDETMHLGHQGFGGILGYMDVQAELKKVPYGKTNPKPPYLAFSVKYPESDKLGGWMLNIPQSNFEAGGFYDVIQAGEFIDRQIKPTPKTQGPQEMFKDNPKPYTGHKRTPEEQDEYLNYGYHQQYYEFRSRGNDGDNYQEFHKQIAQLDSFHYSMFYRDLIEEFFQLSEVEAYLPKSPVHHLQTDFEDRQDNFQPDQEVDVTKHAFSGRFVNTGNFTPPYSVPSDTESDSESDQEYQGLYNSSLVTQWLECLIVNQNVISSNLI